MLEKTDGTIKNGQSRDIGNVGHTIHRTNKCYRKPMGQSRMDNPEILTTLATQYTGRRRKKNKTKQSIFQKVKQISNTDNTNKKPGMNPDAREGKQFLLLWYVSNNEGNI